MLQPVPDARRTPPADTTASDLATAAARIEASGVFGRSQSLLGLLRYLVARSGDARAPREIDIAQDVFDRTGSHDPVVDSTVRVQIYRLREKLKAYARGPGSGDAAHLVLPHGEYRIALAVPVVDSPPAAAVAGPGAARPQALVIMLVLALVVLAAIGGALAGNRFGGSAPAMDSPLWRGFATSKRPLILVVGDYYILGESDDGLQVSRLVREYDINSVRDLDDYLMEHPEQQRRYRDLGLAYVPTSATQAVSDVTRLFAGRKIPQVVMTSDLTADQIKNSDIIYVGYLSGLGMLRDMAFDQASRFSIGETYDDITDRVARQRYTSQGGLGPAQGEEYRDYAYTAFFTGPGGGRIAILAGTRDIGAAAVADRLTEPAEGRALASTAGAGGVEALYEVLGHGTVDLAARRLLAAPRRADTP